jgi:hypothetical protein
LSHFASWNISGPPFLPHASCFPLPAQSCCDK